MKRLLDIIVFPPSVEISRASEQQTVQLSRQSAIFQLHQVKMSKCCTREIDVRSTNGAMSKKSAGKVRCIYICERERARQASKHLPSLGEKPQPTLVNHEQTQAASAARNQSQKFLISRFPALQVPCPMDLARLCRCASWIIYASKQNKARRSWEYARALKHMQSAVKANHFTFLPLGRSGGCGAGSAAIDGFSDAAR